MRLGLAIKAVIIDDAGQTLLLRRSPLSRHFAGEWEWPGGKVDPGEDVFTALRREVREETGLEVEPTHLAGAAEFDLGDVRVILLCLNACVTGGTFALSREHDAFDWVPPAQFVSRSLAANTADFMIDYARRREAEGGYLATLKSKAGA